MTDGNTYYNPTMLSQEEYDFKDEYEEIAADNVRLEADLTYWKADSAAAWDKCEENRLKLAEAVQGLEDALEVGMAYSDDRLGYDGAISLLNRLKGKQDE